MPTDYQVMQARKSGRDESLRVLNMNTGELTKLVSYCYLLTHGDKAIFSESVSPLDVLGELKEITRVNA
jgi:hypothetical protein|tara:strand:+ start:1734 stop:1940 length:207 start_codon:yes stop_codon:yes gene_type:complete